MIPSLFLFVPNARTREAPYPVRLFFIVAKTIRAAQKPSSRVDMNSAAGFVMSGEQSGIKRAPGPFCSSVVNESVEDASVTGLLGRHESWSLELQPGRRL